MTPNQERLISLLLGSFPTFQSGDAEAALGSYAFVIRNADERDVERGVGILINGEYPGHDGRFAPTAPQFASAIRMARDKRLDSERLTRLALPPPPEADVSEEERERVKARFENLLASMVEKSRTDEATAAKREKEQWDRVNDRFMPDMSDAAVQQRLMGYSVGVPESDENAA